MADLNVKMGVSGVSQFIQGMQQAGASVKTIDAALKQNEKQLKATGDAATYMQQKEQLLQGKLTEQKRIIKETETALKTLEANGTSKVSKSYQDMQRRLLEAQTAMMDTQEQINDLGAASVEASEETDKLANSLGGLNKKVSLEQVTSAIGAITGGLEQAGRKAIEVGKLIWENITDTARYADDTATSAMILDMDVERYQAYRNVFATEAELTVQEWQKAKQKVQNAINAPTDDQDMIFKLLGIDTHEMVGTKYARVEGAARNYEEVFWEIGKRLREKVANGEISQDLADTYANALFGKSFANLNPIFEMGEEAFNAAVDSQVTASKEAIENNAKLNDTLIDLQNDFESLKQEVLNGLSPALTSAAQVLDGLLERLIKYLQSEDGQKAIENMEKAVEGLFSDLSSIDPEQVVAGFSEVFTRIVDGLTWMSGHSGEIIGALEAVVIGWGALKLTGGALEIYKLIQGILGLGGAAGAAAEAGAAAGASWGGAFANAVLAAAPWLAGLITLLHLDPTDNNDVLDPNGELSEEGFASYKQEAQRYLERGEMGRLYELVDEAAKLVNNAEQIWNDDNAIRALGRYASSGDADRLLEDLIGLGYTKKRPSEELTEMKTQEIDLNTLLDASDGAEQIQEQVGTVEIPAVLVFGGFAGGIGTGGSGGGGMMDYFAELNRHSYANGLWSVPFDGYHAVLHKGERIVPAREVASSRNYSSNLYVESMYMNNGQDAEGLASAMAAAQRRTSSGYGS